MNTGGIVAILKLVWWKKPDKYTHNYNTAEHGLREQHIHNANEAQKRDNPMRQGKLSERGEV